MFDYKPEYTKELLRELENIENEEIREIAKQSARLTILSDIAEEFDKTCDDGEIAKEYKDFCKNYPLAECSLGIVVFLSPRCLRKYILHLVFDICKAVEDDSYDRAMFDVPSECETCEDTVIHIPSEYKDGCYYKPIHKEENVFDLTKYGLCCANCSDYHNGYCCNRVYYSDIFQPRVEPYQICECHRLARKYGGYYFSENGLYNGIKTEEHKKVHFSEVAEEVIRKTKEKLREKEDFIEFIKSEIPDVYNELLKQYKKKWRKIK